MTDKRPLRVLVVDDHPTMLDMMRQMIELLGHQPLTAGCLTDAAGVNCDDYDVLLCDFRLGDGEAPQLRTLLLERGATVPMVLLTAFDTHALSAEEMDGFRHVLTKPLDMNDLGRLLERLAGECA